MLIKNTHEMLYCDNFIIRFELNGKELELNRDFVELRYKIYWFCADLYDQLIKKVIRDEKKLININSFFR